MDQVGKDDLEALKQRRQLFAKADAACLDSQIGIMLNLTDAVDVGIDKIHRLVPHPCVHAGHEAQQEHQPIDQWYLEVARLNNYLRKRWTAQEKESLVGLLTRLEEALQSLLSSSSRQTVFTPVPRQSAVLMKVNALLVICLREK